MQVYTVIKDFTLSIPCSQALSIGDTVGKLDDSVGSVINGTDSDSQAFYDWVGSAGSLEFLSFTGTIPDPSVGGGVPATPVAAPATPTSTGVQGTWATDSTYLYWCIATDIWVRWVVVTNW
jgi:hypothetical protein